MAIPSNILLGTFLVCLLLVVVVIYQTNNDLLKILTPPLPSIMKLKTITLETSTKIDEPNKQIEKPILLLFWSKLWGKVAYRVERKWLRGDKDGQCPVACEVTSDKSRASQSNAFIVHARDPKPLPPNKTKPWVLTTLENPVYTPVLRNRNYMSQFNLLRSYRLDSDFPTPSFNRKPDLTPPVPFKNKTGDVMAAFSNCERVRTEYVRQLMKFVKVDSYGGCLRNKEQKLIRRYGNNFKDAKVKLARSYKFLIVFFNQDCDYFVDDQILHAMNAGAVPIVMSTAKIQEFLPGNLRHSIVNVRDFKGPKHLANYLKFLSRNETEYNKFLEWKFKGLGNISETVIGKHWLRKHAAWCQVCVAISEGRWHREGLKADLCKSRRYTDWGITPGDYQATRSQSRPRSKL